MSCNGADGADGCGERMEKIQRDHKGRLIAAVLDKLDELVDGYNEIKGKLGDIIDSRERSEQNEGRRGKGVS